jgi:predicted nucleic acid-binding protein
MSVGQPAVVLVADSSPLIAFARADQLPVLWGVTGGLVVPQTVWRECTEAVPNAPATADRPGTPALRQAHAQGWIGVLDDTRALSMLRPLPSLDAGEMAAIALALELRATVLMDERLGRDVAQRRGLAVVGSAGVLIRARQMGLLPVVAPVLARMKAEGYFLSEALVREVLRRVGEET